MLKDLNPRLPEHIVVRTPKLNRAECWTSGLPFDAIEELLCMGTSQSDHRIFTPTDRPGGPQTMISNLTVDDGLDFIDWDHHCIIESSWMGERDTSIDKGNLVHRISQYDTPETLGFTVLKSVLPQPLAEEYLSRPFDDFPSTRDLAIPLYRQVLFSLANSFAGLDGADMKKIMRFLQKETSQGLFQLISRDLRYSPRAVAQSIFKGAIEIGDARLIDLILSEKSIGIDLNRLWCCGRYTPIERASLLRHKEAIKVLLRHKADVNRTYPGPDRWYQGALGCAVGTPHGDTRVDSQIFRMLLNAGGDLPKHTLANLIHHRDGEFVGLLMSANGHKNVAKWSRWGTFIDAVQFLDDPTALAVIQIMLRIHADLNFWVKRPTSMEICPSTVIDAAARRGNVEIVQTLLRFGALETYETFLFAIMSGNRALIRLLLDGGANINSHHETNITRHATILDYTTTPFAEAIRLQNAETIGMFERYGAVRLDDQEQFSAAIIAASEVGNATLIERLLEPGAQARMTGLGFALGTAIEHGQVETATMLIDAGALLDQDIARRDPLNVALTQRNAALVHLLLEAGALPTRPDCGNTLSTAIEWGDHSIVETLIHAGAAINATSDLDDAPLTLAANRQDHALVKLLLDNGAVINTVRFGRMRPGTIGNALEAALRNEDISMAAYLLERGADPLDTYVLGKAMVENPNFFDLVLEKHRIRYSVNQTKFGCNALRWAVELGNEHCIRIMLERGLDGNTLTDWPDDELMKSPFGHAIYNSTVEVMELFLQRGCNPNSIIADCLRYSHRLTALLAAVDTRNVSKVKLLHRYGADVNYHPPIRVKYTPLQEAARIGSTDIVELLIGLGAEVNAPAAQRGGGTALQLAAIEGYIPVACLLLEFQADVNAPASKVDGRMALEGAAEHGRLDMLQLLLNAGAGNEGRDQGQITRAKKLAEDQGYNHITDFLENYIQRKRQEAEPVALAECTGDYFGDWDLDWEMDGMDMALLGSWT